MPACMLRAEFPHGPNTASMLPTLGSGVLQSVFQLSAYRHHEWDVLCSGKFPLLLLPGAGAHPEKMQRAIWIHIDAARDIQAAKGCER